MLPYYIKSLGVVSFAMLRSHPAVQIQRLMEDADQIGCATITQITAYSLEALDIPVRLVALYGWINSVPNRPHAVNEILDPLTGDWFVTDLTLQLLFIKNASGQKLNLFQAINHFSGQDLAGLSFCYYDESQSEFREVDFQHLPGPIQNWLNAYYRLPDGLIFFSSKSHIFNRTSFTPKTKDYLLEYRYLLPRTSSAELYAAHFVFRGALYLTVLFGLICGMILLGKAFRISA